MKTFPSGDQSCQILFFLPWNPFNEIMKDKSKRQKKRYAHPSLTEQSKEGEKQKNHQSKFIPEYLMTFMKNAPVFVTKYLSVEWKTKVSSYIYMLYV